MRSQGEKRAESCCVAIVVRGDQYVLIYPYATLKAVLHNVYKVTMEQMIMCKLKGVACIEEPTENYHTTLVPFSSLFWFYSAQLIYCGSVSLLSLTPFPAAADSCF